MSDYLDFLRKKIKLATFKGFKVGPSALHEALFPHQRDIVQWAVLGGNRAIFAKFGLGKSVMQCEWLRQVVSAAGGRGLIVCPLGVRQELIRDAAMVGVALKFIRSITEFEDDHAFYITNYETIRDGKLDPDLFTAVSLDEASVLRSFGSKTYQEFLPLFDRVKFKLVNTATPSPNRFKELIHYAAFLGVMDSGQALTRFFQRDSEKAGNLTLYPHKEQEFWLWVSSWAVFVQYPSDLGHSDEGYVLPELDVRYHEVPSDYAKAGHERDGQALMFTDPALGLSAAAREKNDSMPGRVAAMGGIIDGYLGRAQGVPAAVLRGEQGTPADEAARAQRGSLPGQQGQAPGEDEGVAGCQPRTERGVAAGVSGTAQGRADHEEGGLERTQPSACAGAGARAKVEGIRPDAGGVRRGADGAGSGVPDLRAADEAAGGRSRPRNRRGARAAMSEVQLGAGPVLGLPGHPDASALVSDQIVIWCDLNAEQEAIEAALTARGLSFSSVHGGNSTEHNEDLITDWKARKTYALIGKPVMLGQGMNLQQCNKAIFVGVTYKFNDLIQAVHRIQRFGQKRECHAHIVYSEAEREVLRSLQTKWAQHEEMVRINFGNVTGAGVPTVSPFHAEALFHGVKHGFDYMGMITVVTDVVRENNQTYRLGYTEMCKDGSKMGVGSPEYILLFHKPQTDRSKGYADVPILKSKSEYSLARWQVDAHSFWRSSGNRQLSAKEMASYGPAKLAKAFTEYSLANVYDYEFHVKIGEELLHAQALPSTFMSLAPGSHAAEVWHDVVRMITLNSEQSKRAVEKHVCPLQFDIVDRLIDRYSLKDELVYDPFCGLGTVPYRAILKGRRGGGSELNTAYFLDQVHYLKSAEREFSMPGLFDFEEAQQESVGA